MNEISQRISEIGVVPVIKLNHPERDAALLAKALCAGGVPVAEVTFRAAGAATAIKLMAEACPEMLVGAGTVLTTDQVDEALAAGAKFIVTPGLDPEIVKYCQSKNLPIYPGCTTPTDYHTAYKLGLEVLKFFPAEQSGGLAKIKAMAAPYVNMKFMPTGGINEKNVTSYLDFDKVIACGGSWMVNKDMVKAGDFESIKKLTKKAVEVMLGFEVKHVGINGKDGNEAEELGTVFEKMFGFEKKVGNSSIFAGTGIEIMKSSYLGTNGHIAIQTNYIQRAMYHLEKRGFSFNMETAKYDEKSNLKAVYFNGEFGGFALHLVQK